MNLAALVFLFVIRLFNPQGVLDGLTVQYLDPITREPFTREQCERYLSAERKSDAPRTDGFYTSYSCETQEPKSPGEEI